MRTGAEIGSAEVQVDDMLAAQVSGDTVTEIYRSRKRPLMADHRSISRSLELFEGLV